MSNEEKLVTIATFEDSGAADFAKQMLEQAGIHAAVVGANFSNMYPIAPLARNYRKETPYTTPRPTT
mgnify:CR=1 FL=1